MPTESTYRLDLAERHEIPAEPGAALVDPDVHPVPRKRPHADTPPEVEQAAKTAKTTGNTARRRRQGVKQSADPTTTITFPQLFIDNKLIQAGNRNEELMRKSMENDILMHVFMAKDMYDLDALTRLVAQIRLQWVVSLGWDAITKEHHVVIEYALRERHATILKCIVLAALDLDLGFREALVRCAPKPLVHPVRYGAFMNPQNGTRSFPELTRMFRNGENGLNDIVPYVARCCAVYATLINPYSIYTPPPTTAASHGAL